MNISDNTTVSEFLQFLIESADGMENGPIKTEIMMDYNRVIVQLIHLTNCYQLPAYEPKRSV